MPISSAYHPRLTTRQLLVSVQNADEARVALDAGISWVDLKDPFRGSLGCPSVQSSQAFLACAGMLTGEVTRSAALGEWLDWQDQPLPQYLFEGFPIVKLGLAGAADCDLARTRLDELRDLADSHACHVVWALYADRQRANAPSADRMLELAQRFRSPYVLIDTWCKDGRGLFDWLTVVEIQEIHRRVLDLGADLVVAGSLRTEDWARLDQLGPVVCGIRGAVCSSSEDRTTELCPERLSLWRAWIECH